MMSRRKFMSCAGVLSSFFLYSPITFAEWALFLPPFTERSLKFYNIHTGESLSTTYWLEGKYVESSMKEIFYILRDFRTNEVKPIDINIFDILFLITKKLETDEPVHVISGYRSPETNYKLRREGRGVAKHSLHIEGRAIDIRIPNVPLPLLRDTALSLKAGGVGYYPNSQFVHIDTGRVRHW
ncbi:MAG: DUF882 domain-containing protein [Aquificaceae bacterium]